MFVGMEEGGTMEQEIDRQNNVLNKSGVRNIDVSIIVFLLFYILIMRGLHSETYLTFAFMLTWIYIAFITDIGSFIKALKNKNMLFLYIYFLYTIVISLYFEGLVTSLGNIIGQLTLFIGILIFNYYKNKCSIKSFKRLLSIVVIIWVYYCIKALIFYSNNPYAARKIISHNGGDYGDIAIGGAYGLAYGSAILGVHLFSLLTIHHFQNKIIKSITIILTVVFFLITMETGSTITLLAMIMGLLFNLLLSLGRKKGKLNRSNFIRMVIGNISIISIVLLILLNLKNIGAWLIDNSSSLSDKLIASRVEQIGIKLLTGSNEGTLGARELLYNQSINTFSENLLFGTSLEYGLRMNTLIGGHSELFDNLGKLGLVGIIPFLLIFYQSVKIERKQNKGFDSGEYILTLLILFIFNPFNYSQANFVLFFIIPSIGLFLNNKNDKVQDYLEVKRIRGNI